MSEEPATRLPSLICKSILICGSFTRDDATGTLTLVGVLNTLVVPSFPGSTKPHVVFLHLTGGTGTHQITFEIIDLADGSAIRNSLPIAVSFTDRRELIDCLLEAPSLTLDRPGAFDMVAFADGQEIARLPFHVIALFGG